MVAKHPYKRADRVADQVRRVISEALVSHVHHHGLEGVAVTGVTLTDDLQHARVYYRVLDQASSNRVRVELKRMVGALRARVGRELSLRYAPDLRFVYDDSLDYGARMDRLLESIPKDQGQE